MINTILIVLIYIIVMAIINHIDNKFLIKNNIDLFIKRHEKQVIHEINNELFKKDMEVLDLNEKNK